MKKKAIFLLLSLILLLAFSTFAFAGNNQNEPVNTATEFSGVGNCDECEGDPVLQQLRFMVQRQLLRGENGFHRFQMQQRFGN